VEALRVLKFFNNLLIVVCITITPCFILDLLQISSIIFFFGFVPISSFMPLVVDHVTGVVVVGGCDQPITCTSLGKSTTTTPSASTFGTFGASSSGSVGVEVPNVHVIPTSLEAPKTKKTQM
jgi:hypothetical protein